MKTLSLNAPAKINLFLEVTGILPNGYHTLRTVMHSIDLIDTVTLTLTDRTGEITMACSDPAIPCSPENLVCRAARQFLEAFGVESGVHIDLIKRIPAGGGLGGGSADAGAVLRGMDQLCGTHIPVHILTALGSRFGADIPFCVVGGAFSAGGIGDLLSPCTPLPDCEILVVQGRHPVATPEAFARLDRIGRKIRTDDPMPAALDSGDLTAIAASLYNAFEVTVPTCREAKDLLTANGALGALMSGSGSAVYGIFAPGADLSPARGALAARGYVTFPCKPA